ncbi:hypothetical protein HY570_01595 [Candidatus Micrarchaeota archaeon]|nr:hypothetical protein [Candidatus Micrarchaeota archaeon]
MASKAPVAVARILISIVVGIAIGYYSYIYGADNPFVAISEIGAVLLGLASILVVYVLLSKLGKGSGDS